MINKVYYYVTAHSSNSGAFAYAMGNKISTQKPADSREVNAGITTMRKWFYREKDALQYLIKVLNG